MLFDLKKLVLKYKLHIRGIIHIGAHYGEEIPVYEALGIKNLACFEPLPEAFSVLKQRVGGKAILYNIALGNENKQVDMYIETANRGMSSSILLPKLHTRLYPHILFDTRLEVPMKRLDDIALNMEQYNMINIDVQGYEMEVFRGGVKSLEHIDYIFTEVNRAELYENCARVEEIDKFLALYGFSRIKTNWAGKTWGDALYIKNAGWWMKMKAGMNL